MLYGGDLRSVGYEMGMEPLEVMQCWMEFAWSRREELSKAGQGGSDSESADLKAAPWPCGRKSAPAARYQLLSSHLPASPENETSP